VKKIRKQATTTKILITLLLLSLALVLGLGVVSAADTHTSTTVNSVSSQKLAPVEISGMVKKCSDGTTFQGAKVTAKNNGKLISSTTTKSDGTYILSFQSTGRIFNVTASANGHKPSTQKITVNKNTQGTYTGKANFQLGANDAYVWNGWTTNPNQDVTFSDGTTIHLTGATNAFTTILNAITWINPGYTVYIAPSTYYEHGMTIGKSITLHGENQASTIINGQNSASIFFISAANVNIQQLTLTQASGFGGAIDNENGGGLSVSDCTFTNNRASYGGAIYNTVIGLSVTDCTFTENTATSGNGGAIANTDSGLSVSDCTFTENTAYYGGAIYNTGSDVSVSDCTFTENTATGGFSGAIFNFGTLCEVHFSRIIGNTGPDIYNAGSVNAENNWWGSNFEGTNPQTAGRINGPVINWVVLTVKAVPDSINNGATSTITADFNHINGGDPLTGGHVPDGPITLNIPWGSFTNPAITHTITKTTDNGAITPTTFYANEGPVNPTYNPVKVTATADGYTTTDTESEYITINPVANLAITKTGPTTAIAGNSLTYTITITNNGPDNAAGVTLHDVMTGTDAFNIGTLQYRYQTNGGAWSDWTSFSSPLNLNLGTIDNGNTAVIEIRDTVKSSASTGTQIINTATTDTTTTPGLKTATITTTVNTQSDLVVTKTGPTKVIAGNIITYTITVTNNGPSDARNVQIQDTIPSILQNVSHDSFNLGTITAGNSKTATITGTIPSNTAPNTIITNTATVTSDTPGTITPGSISTSVDTQSDIVLTKTVDKKRPNVGDKVTFTVTTHNNGPSDTTNLQIQDIMPSGFTDVTITPSKGTYNNGIWTLNLANGETATLTLTCKVTAKLASKTTTNTAKIQGTTKSASTNIYVPKSDLYVKITSNKNNPKVSEKFTLTYKLGNRGPDPAENVTITIPLPASFELAGINGDGTWTYNKTTHTITWTLTNVLVGDPYLYVTGKTTHAGLYVFSSSISSETYNLNSEGVNPITISTTNSTNPITPINSTTTVKAVTTTIPMPHTGVPIAGLILAILMVFGGSLIPKLKK
jgi:uncharacterized repeat protein (TIGR01451 family)